MNIRSLELIDLPALSRYRNSVLLLDSTRALTRGNPIGAANFLSHFNPANHIYTAVLKENGDALLGCVTHTPGETFARLLYLAPTTNLEHPGLIALLENLSREAGTWSALHVIAEVEETSAAFTALRTSGFSVYARQRLWDISSIKGNGQGSSWMRAQSVDLPAIQSLYHQIVPPLLQPVEPMPRRAAGFICSHGVRCHVSLSSGSAGIVLAPLIHPDVLDVGLNLSALVGGLPGRGTRPVYLCVRSYQVWLEPVLEELGALAGPRQVVMVKHLARMIKEEQPVNVVQPAGVRVQPSRVSHIEGKRRP
jgi:hypothetical protein